MMKKIFAVLLAAAMSIAVFAACSKEDETTTEEAYTGVLSKVRLGMPMNKIIALNSGTELYYDNETEIWCVNPDTDLMEIKALIPEDNQFCYVDDSLITYSFRHAEAEQEDYLKAYLEEAPCLIDRPTAEKYYEDKIARLTAKYKPGEGAVRSTITGTEDVDLNLDYITTMTLSSFEVTFTMRLTYDTVDGVDGYYATYFSIEVEELQNKTAVDVSTSAAEKEE